MNVVRPPELWNYPKVIEEHHKFRCIAKPRQCYDDLRIDEIDKNINILADKLNNFRRFTWKELVERVIDVYGSKYNDKPSSIDPREDPDWEQPEPTPHEIQVQKNREIKMKQLMENQALIEAVKNQQMGIGQDENKENKDIKDNKINKDNKENKNNKNNNKK
ncbi:hypothetical protein IMG5_171050 [Ichthyophthirius multifiliis]|uniref:Uncharacterized protein n=1 Tax=Ichthyophthirius multifiliis TaxID=5932 RepID=G0R1K2_ICHMU|nr:hypothetical protein IMG5_171050 [Ichthyophthirius multifiliis]EGR28651.1 hypothetical protein IMG5_171050 [Ichthyophthirius multifiliis]|eukprot:XP_004029887.1 hypothetical protein IMG5_171050 [Ichthyophthirius multifiliis]